MAKYAAQMPAEAPNITPAQTTTVAPQAPRPMQGPQVNRSPDKIPNFKTILKGSSPETQELIARATAGKKGQQKIETINATIDKYNECQDPTSSCAINAEKAGIKIDRETLNYALKTAGLEVQLCSGGSSSVTASGRIDKGCFNHYAPEERRLFNKKLGTNYSKGSFYSTDPKYRSEGSEVALLYAGMKLKKANQKVEQWGVTYDILGYKPEQVAYSMNTNGNNLSLERMLKHWNGYVDPNKNAYVGNWNTNIPVWGGIADAVTQVDLDIIDAQATLYADNN